MGPWNGFSTSDAVNADQPFWRQRADAMHPALAELRGRDETAIGPIEGRRIIADLHAQGFTDDGEPNVRTPVRLHHLDGRPVAT